jgi:serine/threonine-protein kinase
VKRVPVGGGSPVVLCDATDLLGATWGEDGTIVAALNPTGRLWRVPETGGVPRALFDLSAEHAAPVWPQLLPGDEAVLYSTLARDGADGGRVEVFSVRTGTRTVLVRGGTYGRYLSNGYLTYVNQGTLYAVPFDVRRLAIRGTAAPVLENVAYSRTFAYAQLDIARSGTLIYRRSAGAGQFAVVLLDRAGAATPVLSRPGRYAWARMSPDGRALALTAVESGTAGLWIGGTEGSAPRRVAGPSVDYYGLTWWPDARHLLIGGRSGMSWIDAQQPAQPTPLTTKATLQVPWSVSPGGRLAYHELSATTGFDLWTVPVTPTAHGLTAGAPEPFLRTPAFEVYPAFSPDGRWIAYGSNESGATEIYVRRYPDNGTAVRVSVGGGRIPAWSPNARELLYQTDNNHLMVAGYRVENGAFVPSPPRAWTLLSLGDAWVFPSFALAGDDAHVLALVPAGRPEDQQTPNHVTVVLNFPDEVARSLDGTRAAPPGR